ncbi:hypothetical protein JOD20_005013 [Herpetosiphon giganteus]|nr:hypothetical protein [Herpetosiphon giganteus]
MGVVWHIEALINSHWMRARGSTHFYRRIVQEPRNKSPSPAGRERGWGEGIQIHNFRQFAHLIFIKSSIR